MLCPECGWWDDWEDNSSPYCEFCGTIHGPTPEDPPEAHEAIAEARADARTESE